MTEQQLRQALATARADLEAAPRARKALLERRSAMLLTASVDEIIALDDTVWGLGIAVEIAQAKIKTFGIELGAIERERARWVGVDMPTDAELKQLLALIESEYPKLLDRGSNSYISRNFDAEFKSAFYVVGLIARLAEPTQKITFSTHADRLNGVLRTRGHAEVEADVIMAAAIAWGDVDFRLQDMRYGQLTEVSLDPLFNTGRAPAAVWRRLLDGSAALRQPLPARAAPRRVVRQGADANL